MSAVDSPAYIHSLCTARHLTYILCSLGCNAIGDEGASALAAILNETMISTLEYAAPPPRLDTLAHHFHPAPRSQRLIGNQIGSKGAAALADILNKTNITNLKCATANQVFALFLVSAP